MKINLGGLFAIYLILFGMIGLFGVSFGALHIVVSALAIAAGVFSLLRK